MDQSLVEIHQSECVAVNPLGAIESPVDSLISKEIDIMGIMSIMLIIRLLAIIY